MHYGTEEQKDYYLPRLADGREVPCFAPDRSVRGFGRHLDPRLRHRLPGRVERRARARRPADLRQALHHAGAGRDADRPGLPHVRPGRPARRQARHRHHAGAGAARHRRAGDRPPPFPAQLAVPERPDPRQGRVRPAVPADRRRGLRRQGLADAGRMPVDRPLDHPALHRQRRRQDRPPSSPARTRASASSSACRSAASKASRKRWRASAGNAYAISALSQATAAAVARGEKPAVPSTIAKYHCTEMGREVGRRRDGHPRRQGHHPRPAQLPRPRLAGRADRDHGRRRQHHDALADDLRPGRDPAAIRGC